MHLNQNAGQRQVKSSISRRALLRSLGVTALAAPFVAAKHSHALAAAKEEAAQQDVFWRPVKMDVISAIQTRRTHRDFTGEPVSREDLQTILSCGMAAPSAKSLRPWEFVVLTKPESLKKIPLAVPLTAYATKAGAAILVCVDTRERPGSHLSFISTALCAQNMMLAATGLGYGSVWIELYPNEEYIKAWRILADLPEYIVPLCILAIGRPTVPLPPVDHTDPKKIHYESW